MNYGLRFVTLYRRQGSRPFPWKKKKKYIYTHTHTHTHTHIYTYTYTHLLHASALPGPTSLSSVIPHCSPVIKYGLATPIFLTDLSFPTLPCLCNLFPLLTRSLLDAWGWCTGTTQRDGMGREEGGGFRMGNTCIPVADSF